MFLVLVAVLIGTALLSAFLIAVLKPVLVRYALARPNARSSHKVPTPQGGGIAVVGAVLTAMAVGFALIGVPDKFLQSILAAACASLVLAIVGAIDDIRPLPAGLRLVLQIAAVAAVVLTTGIRVLPEWVPPVVEQVVLILGGVWFVNLVNFMDGLDWITVAEMVPVVGAIAILGFGARMPLPVIFVASALCGALLGFAPFNKPVARLFLGDVGSLPIGLLVGWMLLHLAGTGAVAAAILLPLYYLMDATITLLRRLARREKVWEAHRSHFYQQATNNGFSVMSVSAHVFGLNLVLAGLAAMTLVWPSGAVQIAALALGTVLVGLVLRRFSQPGLEVSR
ncbi:glycosyltransferase family 4 protein [Microvirga sp. 3-52]|uniref:MraY family glycosyltransferase n=1 Tax=Microvirga sp. 3-52 TaxID=2792425 RepID=UPI001AC165F7|nr:glycosyltransferase family 4 protein [Microvirga sp. 3-52]MBO1905722.1 glycosyltransferase family 4 protein [Microvirga sp. 3-52]MBS7453016.1 glycosyltransferase family 4 protein [Microvirga sp. 3-52]